MQVGERRQNFGHGVNVLPHASAGQNIIAGSGTGIGGSSGGGGIGLPSAGEAAGNSEHVAENQRKGKRGLEDPL